MYCMYFYIVFIFQTNERHAHFDDTNFNNCQLNGFMDMPYGLYLLIIHTSKSTTIIL